MSEIEKPVPVGQPRLVRRLLLWAARCHPKNQTAANIDYPQLWYCWPRWTKRVKWVHRLKTWLCGKITGHEWSETESGYSGCGVDRWCRWCDKMVTMPLCESPLSGEMKDISTMVRKARQSGNWSTKMGKTPRRDYCRCSHCARHRRVRDFFDERHSAGLQ